MAKIIKEGQELPDRVTIVVSTLDEAAMEIHRQNMWEKGYRLESQILAHKFFQSDGRDVQELFEGKPMYAATFVKQ